MTNNDQPSLHVGDHVQDREDDDATLLVTGISPQPANHYTVNGDQTVADYNPDYPADDDVVEVRYPQRTTSNVSQLDTYAFPRTRLKLAEPLHARDENEVEC
ncbi:hypothetical protein [Halobacterium hubeiense]|uniref:hypothetical protein n=1 Tax=Halobacterium hubeiense TaxID=1407499 RepID=UPI000B7ED1DE|nr:hypothetical protein [Halobacterium hubeiense]